MGHYPDLERMLTDMSTQEALYRPTAYWDQASKRIADEFSEYGIDRFRQAPAALEFFVPTYGTPGNRFTQSDVRELSKAVEDAHPDNHMPALALRQFLDGEAAAIADYRVLLAADDGSRVPYLHRFSESAAGAPIEQFQFGNRRFSRSALNYLLGLVLIKKHLPTAVPKTVLEIGGGFGTLGEILASSGIDDLRYIDMDIPPTSFAAQWYLTQVLGADNVATYTDTVDSHDIAIVSLPLASVLCSWQVERLRGQVDLFVNFISFQEMEPPVVENYLSHVDRLGARWILLRNLREGQRVRRTRDEVGVDNPTTSDDYLSMLSGYDLVERQVHPFGYRTVDGYHSELLLLSRR